MRHYLIQPTWACQNRCSYCWMQATVGKRPDLMHARQRTPEEWYEALKRDRPELVDIAGGEPLLLDWVPDLMRICRSIRFGLSTNGIAQRGINDLCRSHVPNLISIDVSYHPESKAREYGRIWRDSVSRLKGAGYPIHVNVVNAPGNAKASDDAIAWLRGKDIPCEVSPYEETEHLGEMLPQGLVCKGGIDHLTIAPDGSAWPCLTALRSPYYAELCLGNWVDGTVDVARKPQPCHLNCADYYILAREHSSGDMWGVQARPAEGGKE